MHHIIAPDHPVFDSAAYRRDALLLEVLDAIIRPNAFLLLSDGEQFVIARNRLDLSAWVWTHDDLSPQALERLCGLLHTHFAGRQVHITAKEQAAQMIAQWFERRGFTRQAGMGLIGYRLDAVLMPQDRGPVRLARMDELDELAALHRDFQMACFNEVREPDSQGIMRQRIEKGSLRVLEQEGEIAAFVAAAPLKPGQHTRVGMVYTRPQMQGRGYAKWLTAQVCQDELTRCPFAILYADADNPRSNAAYQRIGFRPLGVAREIRLSLAER